MIDSITMKIPISEANVNINKFYEKNPFYPLPIFYDNVRVSLGTEYITIKGSIPKYRSKENITLITKEQYIETLDRLSLELNIDLHKCYVVSVEIGKSIILEHPVWRYLQCFSDYRASHDKAEYIVRRKKKTVLYASKTGSHEFYAYDKIAEMRNSSIPKEDKGKHVLRMEYRIKKKKGITDIFGRSVSPYELVTTDMYGLLQYRFNLFYRSIEKRGRHFIFTSSDELFPSTWNDLMAESYRQDFPEKYDALLQTARDSGILSKRSYDKIRASNRKKSKANITYEDNDLIQELNSKCKMKDIPLILKRYLIEYKSYKKQNRNRLNGQNLVNYI